jgi:hypothetical protein
MVFNIMNRDIVIIQDPNLEKDNGLSVDISQAQFSTLESLLREYVKESFGGEIITASEISHGPINQERVFVVDWRPKPLSS